VSYILDALKKAERDRRRAHVPSLATMHSVPAERRTLWPWVVGGLVTVNAIGFAALFMLRPGTPPAMPFGPAPAIPAVAAPPIVANPPAADPAVIPPAAVSGEPAPRSRPPDARKAAFPESRTAPSPAKASGSPPVSPSATPARLEPGDLKLEVLVYSEEAAQRAAYINGHRYVEGQRVGGRFLVEQILKDGVVLSANGKRFPLRQE
jgi:hypothetical protein